MTHDSNEEDDGPFAVDRRRHRRVELDTKVRVRSGGSDSTPGLSETAEFTVEGEGEDISVGGLYLIAEERLSAGTEVEVEFEIPEIDESFDLPAQVRWTRRRSENEYVRWGIGLEFLEIAEDRLAALDAYVLETLTE